MRVRNERHYHVFILKMSILLFIFT